MSKRVSFNDLINGNTPVLVEFSAEWCGPCKAMKPILKEVSKKIGDKARIIKIDVDKNRAVASKMAVRAVPTFILFKRGKSVWREPGMQSAYQLINIIEQHSN